MDAKIVNLMIASPSDVLAERQIIRDVVSEWNNINSEREGMVLITRGWETDVAPEMGSHPQNIINSQILEKADILVAVFWTRIGTETIEYESGSVEEIKRHIDKKKPTMIYFSLKPLPQDHDNAQFTRLKEFKVFCETNGVYGEYKDEACFKDLFRKHLQLRMNCYRQKLYQTSNYTDEKSKTHNVNGMSFEEQIIVKVLSIGDTELHVNTVRTLGDRGVNICSRSDTDKARLNFNLSNSKREFVKWAGVVEGLVVKGFLESRRFGSGKCYSLSHRGFSAADTVGEDVLDNVPSEIDTDVEALSENEKTMIKAVSTCDDRRIACSTDIISGSERIETIDGRYAFANGHDLQQSILWDEVINSLVKAEMLVPLMPGKGRRYFRITNKGDSVASRISNNVLDIWDKNSVK